MNIDKTMKRIAKKNFKEQLKIPLHKASKQVKTYWQNPGSYENK